MKKFFVLPLAIAAISCAAPKAQAQSVILNGLGSSALFLEAGLAANSSAPCLWTGDNTTGRVVAATDTKNAGTAGTVTDGGNAWVAWTTGTGGSCSSPASNATITAYLQTDSVVGNRCLFNANASTPTCTISYPTGNPTPASLILTSGEVSLPTAVANLLNAAVVNYAGTDIRPEDAEFAIARATAVQTCGTQLNSSQYLALGYDPTSTNTNLNSIKSFFSTSVFHTTPFALPATYQVTPIGAVPIVVAVNGFSSINNIASADLARFLDGTYSYTGQANGSGSSGNPVTVLIREPLSGTYNTMEYNVPNRTQPDGAYDYKTSQDVGLNQSTTQWVCGGSNNPMNVTTPSGAHRRRAIGTGQELAEVLDTTTNGSDILGYGFWSVANFKNYPSSTAHYLSVDGVDPLRTTSVSGNPFPGSTGLSSVSLSHVQDGTYPIWSLIRFVTVNSTAQANAQTLANAAKAFGSTSTRPDFVSSDNMTVVRSHFLPPAGATQPTLASIANGNVGDPSSSCTATEAGGDVGGVVINLQDDSDYCAITGDTNGQTGMRR